ncbi:MAG: transcriptional repressor [Sedimentisphaerales bacterium]|nr:transcriptional repressor [Sedimentisphaerales bacterium]
MMKFAFKEKVDKLLSSARLKRTGQRKAILEVLLKANSPLTADEIVHATGNTGPNRVTIYRTLESMAEAGILHKAFIEGRSRCYEPADKCSENQCHPHFVCTGCGQTHCLTDATVPMATSMPAGFIIKRQQVRLEGLCPECNMTENKRHMHNDGK